MAGTRSGLTAQVGVCVCVCVRVCILQNSPIALSLPLLQASRERGERGGDGQDPYRRWGWLLWLGLSGTGCHGWDCQGMVVMARIVWGWLSWLGLSGAGCHGWDCLGLFVMAGIVRWL